MRFETPLTTARLIKRYKRFLADVILESGEQVTVACPNTGSMMGLAEPGFTVYLSRSANPARKYAWTWEATERPDVGLVGVNTGLANRLAEEAISTGLLPTLAGYSSIRREVKCGENSRIDFLLESLGRPPCYVEVKSVTLFRSPELAEFPDCVTARGAKHLNELSRMAESGARAVMIYLIQNLAARRFALAGDLDRAYFTAFGKARIAGVEAFAFACEVSEEGIAPVREVEIVEQ
ncbi:MAG: DNA/RNA nuclease SfsA [Aestuariivirga sp.]